MVAMVQTPTRPAPMHPTLVMVVDWKAAIKSSAVTAVALLDSTLPCLRSMSKDVYNYDLKQAKETEFYLAPASIVYTTQPPWPCKLIRAGTTGPITSVHGRAAWPRSHPEG
jgi:hypothetical protein